MEWYVWAGFVTFIVILLLVDLLAFQRDAHEVSTKEAAISSAVWVTLGLSFGIVMWVWQGGDAAGEYLAGYLIEKSLSVDNIFVFALIFGYFGVPNAYRHRVLFWGVFGALVLRLAFIFAGVRLLDLFEPMIFVFGAFLLFTAWKMWRHQGVEIHPEDNPVLKLVRRFIPMTNEYHGAKLFTIETGRRVATPLFAVLVMVETSDVIFAIDSIPAVFAVTRDPFIVFTSNAFAILGLRALFFLLEGSLRRFGHLGTGLAAVLGFVGLKMILSEWIHLPIWLSLGVIATILTIAIVASLRSDEAPIEQEVSHSPLAAVFAGLRARRDKNDQSS